MWGIKKCWQNSSVGFPDTMPDTWHTAEPAAHLATAHQIGPAGPSNTEVTKQSCPQRWQDHKCVKGLDISLGFQGCMIEHGICNHIIGFCKWDPNSKNTFHLKILHGVNPTTLVSGVLPLMRMNSLAEVSLAAGRPRIGFLHLQTPKHSEIWKTWELKNAMAGTRSSDL